MLASLRRSLRNRIWTLVANGSLQALRAYRDEAELANKAAYSLKVAQLSLYHRYRELAKAGTLPPFQDAGYRVFSQADEDGLFVYLFGVIGTHSKTFVDIGAGDGVNSNCANLAINLGWYGLFVDGSAQNVARGTEYYRENRDTFLYPPRFICAMVNRDNINHIIQEAGFTGEIDLLSIDIDGNDYWVWEALECVQPRVVCIETHIEKGLRNLIVPYDERHVYPGVHPEYYGASPTAMVRLAARKGYRLVGSNKYGFNTIYVRTDLVPDLVPETTVEQILRHPRAIERFQLFDAVKDMPYVEG